MCISEQVVHHDNWMQVKYRSCWFKIEWKKKPWLDKKKKEVQLKKYSFIGVEILSSAFLLFQSKFNQNLLFTFTVSECFSCYLAYVSNLWRVSVRNCILTQCISNYCILVFFCVYYCKIIRISARLVPKKKKKLLCLKIYLTSRTMGTNKFFVRLASQCFH